MTPRLQFQNGRSYQSTEDGIIIPVGVALRSQRVEAFAILDTGSEYCIFHRRIAESLGMDVEAGHRLKLRTVAGTFYAYGHEVALQTFDLEWSAMVYFHDQSLRSQENFLGRNGWLDRVRLGLVHYDQLVYVQTYDQYTQ